VLMESAGEPKAELLEQFARLGNAMSSPKRLEIIDILAQGERSVEAVAHASGLKMTTASAHLQALRAGGLVRIRKEGTRIYYRLSSDTVAMLFMAVRQVADLHLAETRRAAESYLGSDEVTPVGRDELLDRARAGDVVVLDVRPKTEFDAGHIDGAVSIPLEDIYEHLAQLPTDLDVVAYCRGEYCVLAFEAVRMLRSHGVRARRLRGGMLEWRAERRPTATAQAAPV
jgi:rhodanese-related sulfurtransferase/DNA-binding transcriptional ArsR family regulator